MSVWAQTLRALDWASGGFDRMMKVGRRPFFGALP
jgi:hypothetical protein